MKEYTFAIDGKNYRRVSRRKAQKEFEDGNDVVLCPCNLRPDSAWRPYGIINKGTVESFSNCVNMFEAYNCINEETGKYAAFYVHVL